MFVVLNKEGVKVFAFNETKEQLRELSDNKQIRCPHCEQRAIFHGGNHRIAHFKHAKGANCTYSGEAESEEHLNGKRLIYEWLKNNYPRAKVELECSIKQTNQIADVYVEFDDKNKFAFEIQCSPITEVIWKERYDLYQSVGIKSFWLFGEKYYKEVESADIGPEKTCLKLKSILAQILKEVGHLYFIRVNDKQLIHAGELYNDNYWRASITETKFALYLNRMTINQLQFIKVKLPVRFLVLNGEGISYYRKDLERRRVRAREYWKRKIQKRKDNELLENKKKIRIQEYEAHKKFLSSFKFSEALEQIDIRDRVNLKRVCNELKITDENFPGIFLIRLEDSHYIQTPYFVWLPLVFQKAIFHCRHKENLIFVNGVFEYIKPYIRFSNELKAKLLVNSYLVILEKIGFIEKKRYGPYTSREMKHPFILERKFLPLIEDSNWNKKVALYYSEFNYKEIGWKSKLDQTFIDEDLLDILRVAAYSLMSHVSNFSTDLITVDMGLFDWLNQFITDNEVILTRSEQELLDYIYWSSINQVCLLNEEYDELNELVKKLVSKVESNF